MSFSSAMHAQTKTGNFSLADSRRMRASRKHTFIAPAVILMLVLSAGALAAPPLYTATSQIRVEASPTMRSFPPGAELHMGNAPDETEFNTQARLIVSSHVLMRVIEGRVTRTIWRCDLCGAEYSRHDVVEYQIAKCVQPGCAGHVSRHEELKYPDWVDLRKKWSQDDCNAEPYSLQIAVEILRSRVNVRAVRGTRFINISYTSSDRHEVAAIANMIAEAYRQYIEEESRKQADEALSAIIEQGERLLRGFGTRKGLLQLEAELDEFKHDHKLLISEDKVIEPIDLNALRTRVLDLEVQIVGLEERLRGLENLSREQRIASLQGNQMLEDFRRMLAEQQILLETTRVELGEDHPQITRLQKTVADLNRSIDNEVEGILSAMRIELATLQSRKKALEKKIDEIEEEILEKEQSLGEYRRLAREVERRRDLYNQLMQKQYKEFIERALPSVRISITEEATRPVTPSRRGTTAEETSSAPGHIMPDNGAETPKLAKALRR